MFNLQQGRVGTCGACVAASACVRVWSRDRAARYTVRMAGYRALANGKTRGVCELAGNAASVQGAGATGGKRNARKAGNEIDSTQQHPLVPWQERWAAARAKPAASAPTDGGHRCEFDGCGRAARMRFSRVWVD